VTLGARNMNYDSVLKGRIALYESKKASGERLGDLYLLIPFPGGSLLQHLFLFMAAGGLVRFFCPFSYNDPALFCHKICILLQTG
jgi:hypothetical protein